jgi:hypothetical protein
MSETNTELGVHEIMLGVSAGLSLIEIMAGKFALTATAFGCLKSRDEISDLVAKEHKGALLWLAGELNSLQQRFGEGLADSDAATPAEWELIDANRKALAEVVKTDC